MRPFVWLSFSWSYFPCLSFQHYSPRFRIFNFSALLTVFFLSSCQFNQIWTSEGAHPGTGGVQPEGGLRNSAGELQTPAPLAPWEIWDKSVSSDPIFQQADKRASLGDLDGALADYQELETHAISIEIRTRAFLRRLSTMLKLGRSRGVLDEIAKALQAQGKGINDVDPLMALFSAYAYVHQGDNAQALVWFSLARKRVTERGIIARRAVTDATHLLESCPQDLLNRLEGGVKNDSFLSTLIQNEQSRRSTGATPQPNILTSWFVPGTYMVGLPGRGVKSEPGSPGTQATSLVPASVEAGVTVFGVLLPLSGKYANSASLVKQGLELAASQVSNPSSIRLVFADTKGEAEVAGKEFDRLVQQDGASAILGPMLVKTSEEVASRSDASGIPFLSFTKRPGITDMSRVGFRLGATSENQCEELASYAVYTLKKHRFALISPRESNGEEFARCFPAAVARAGGNVVKQASYVSGNQSSVKAAVDSIGGSPIMSGDAVLRDGGRAEANDIEAIFIPDTLERVAPILETLRGTSLRDVTILGPAYWNDAVAVRSYAPLLENAFFVTPFFAGSERPVVSQFNALYKSKYGRTADLLSAQAYDAMKVLLQGLSLVPAETALIEKGAALAKEMHQLQPIEGVTGLLTVEPNGEISRRMSVIKVQGGDLFEVMAAGEPKALVSPATRSAAVSYSQSQVLTAPRNQGNPPSQGSGPATGVIPASVAKESAPIKAPGSLPLSQGPLSKGSSPVITSPKGK